MYDARVNSQRNGDGAASTAEVYYGIDRSSARLTGPGITARRCSATHGFFLYGASLAGNKCI